MPIISWAGSRALVYFTHHSLINFDPCFFLFRHESIGFDPTRHDHDDAIGSSGASYRWPHFPRACSGGCSLRGHQLEGMCYVCVHVHVPVVCRKGGGGGYKSWVQIDQGRGLEHRVCVTSSVLLWPAYDDKLLRICLPSSLYLNMNFDFQDQL